ncbi:unnamed protein product [Rotaria magnacalcarata]|uniref:Uncharacterized protein n=1 Tax=Rotaria magnacalcarata TaxID=392030 RepID=A0A816P539_9BILA|nr:unnamed protein product [Rotaria magnacalcarata]
MKSIVLLCVEFFWNLALACYQHYEPCLHTPSCLIDENRHNCSNAGETYCFKDDVILSIAVRGCAELAYCNATIVLGRRYCCNTDYCNHAGREIQIAWLMIMAMLMAIVVIIR